VAFQGTLPTYVAYSMYRTFKARDDLSDLDMATHIADFWWAVTGRNPKPSAAGAPWLREAEIYLRDNSASAIRAEEVAAAVGVHRSHLMREFRRTFRQTMGEYLRTVRLERACQLLRNSELAFAEIAAAAGFSDQSHLNRTLKSHLGVTPGEFVRG
jgi:AraC family transcriptional regulator